MGGGGLSFIGGMYRADIVNSVKLLLRSLLSPTIAYTIESINAFLNQQISGARAFPIAIRDIVDFKARTHQL
jgi:hypothetical protein